MVKPTTVLKGHRAAEFPERPNTELFYKWIMFTACITALALFSGFYPVWGNIPFIVVPSILTLVFAKPVFFERMKLLTLVAARTIAVLAALLVFNPDVYVDLILLALVVNIGEATATDFFKHKKIYNGISGLALIAGIFALHGHWTDLLSKMPFGMSYYLVGGPDTGGPDVVMILYIIGYTLWNWIFVTDEFSPSVALMHVGFLLAPVFGCLVTIGMGPLGGSQLWLLLRACSLSIGGWLQIGIKGWFEKEFYSERFERFINWVHTTPVQIVCMVVNIALMAAALAISGAHGAIGFTPKSLFL